MNADNTTEPEGPETVGILVAKSDDEQSGEESRLLGNVEQSTQTRKSVFVKGIIYSLVSGTLFTANNFIIKEFKVNSFDAVLVRGVIQVIILFAFSWCKQYIIVSKNVRQMLLVVLQSILGGLSFIFSLVCVTHMPVSDALVVLFSDPVLTILLSAIFLRERLTVYRVLTGLIIIAGVVLVCRPPLLFGETIEEAEFPPAPLTPPQERTTETPILLAISDRIRGLFADDSNQGVDEKGSIAVNATRVLHRLGGEGEHDAEYWMGFGFAISATLAGGLHNILVPSCGNLKSTVLVLWVGIAAIIVSAIGSQTDQNSQICTGYVMEVSGEMWGIMVGLAFSGMMGYLCITRALQLIPPTIVSSLRSTEIVLAFCVETFLTMTVPPVASVIGAFLVMVGVGGITMEDKYSNLVKALKNRCSSGHSSCDDWGQPTSDHVGKLVFRKLKRLVNGRKYYSYEQI